MAPVYPHEVDCAACGRRLRGPIPAEGIVEREGARLRCVCGHINWIHTSKWRPAPEAPV